MTDQIKMLKRAEIRPSPFNPRKSFDQPALEELALSIKEKGLIEPLVVRPAAKKNGKVRYELVVGERRWRAAAIADVCTLPAIVRELTDAEVLEVMVIENVQRQNLEPLDEAEGYRALLDRGQYDVETLSQRIGRSASYVYQRLKLTELIAPAKERLRADEITAGHAILIARLQPADQKEALAFLFAFYGDRGNIPSVRSLRRWLDGQLHLTLSSAAFSKKDAELYPKAGACTACPKRSGAQPELFADIEKKDVCIDRACFNKKLDRYLERQREELEASGESFLLIGDQWSYYGAEKVKGALARSEYEVLTKKKRCESAVKALRVDGPQRGTVESVCPKKSKCKTHWPWESQRGDGGYTARQRAEDRKRKKKLAVQTRIFEAVRDRLKKPGRPEREIVARRFFDRLMQEDQKRLFGVIGLEAVVVKSHGYTSRDFHKPFATHIAEASGPELERILVQLALIGDVGRDYYDPRNGTPDLLKTAKRLRVNVKKIESEVDQQFRKKPKKKKAK